MKNRIIDAHSHIGEDAFGTNSYLKEYIKEATKLGVTDAIIMPAPSPIIFEGDKKILPCKWEENNGKVTYYKEITDENGTSKEVNPKNPYKKVNELLIKELLDNGNENIQFYPIGLIHPILDTKKYIKELLDNENIYGLKVHGLGTATGAYDFPEDFFKIISKKGKPLTVHTDYIKIEDNFIDTLFNKNQAKYWIKKAIEYNIKIYITHAAQYSKEAIELAEGNKNIIFGFSPDLLNTDKKNRMYEKTEDGIKWCLENIPHGQLAFDIDYAWNNTPEGEKDWNSLERLKENAKELGISEKDLENILYNNAKNFFNI